MTFIQRNEGDCMKIKAALIIMMMTMGLLSGCNTARTTPDAVSLQPSQQDLHQQKLQQAMQS